MFNLSVISQSATYVLTSSVAAVDEGSMVTITLSTTGVQLNQPIPYTISGTNITLSDFIGLSSLSGNFVVGVDGKAYIYLTTNADLVAEGPETFRVTLNGFGQYVAVDINDTSAYQPWARMYASGTLAADPVLGGAEILPSFLMTGYASGTLAADPILGGGELLPSFSMTGYESGTLAADPILGGAEVTTPINMTMYA